MKTVEKCVAAHRSTLLQKTSQGERMKTENREHLNIDEVLGELYYLREENQRLSVDNDFLQKQNALCKQRCSEFSQRIMTLESEIADMKFTHRMLNSEEAGRAFARELLGKPMTREELAISAAENAYEPYTGDDF